MSKKERKVWFITRPERDPKFHLEALEALREATNNFEEKWQGNRVMHKEYERTLNKHNIKRNNVSNDGSGGRTWVAMLKTFSYVYTDEEGYLKPTKVAEAILNEENIRGNISKQILTLQIPNAYYLSGGFGPKFEAGFEIHPARFLVRLITQDSLEFFITKEEITFFVLRAKKNSDFERVTQEIIKFREASPDRKKEMKKEIAAEYDHRERSDKGARDFETAHNDVAHTFMLLCDYTELVEYIRGKYLHMPIEKQEETVGKLEEYDHRYPFSKRYLISLERFAEHAGLDISRYKANSFGDIGPATNSSKSMLRIQKLFAKYPSPGSMSREKIKSILMIYFSEKESESYANLIEKQSFPTLNEDFVEQFLNEEDNLEFENKCFEVLEAIGFKVDLRPKPKDHEEKTEIEIIIHIDDEYICILDAKNYRKKFPLSASLASHMASEYIPKYKDYKGKKIHSFGYITATENWTGKRNLERITKKVMEQHELRDQNIKGAIISASSLLGFLDYCLENELPIEERKNWFISLFVNEDYQNVSKMLKFK